MNSLQAQEWTQTLGKGDKVGVYSGQIFVYATTVSKRTPSGRIVCEPGGTFLPDGEIFGAMADKSRRIRPLQD